MSINSNRHNDIVKIVAQEFRRKGYPTFQIKLWTQLGHYY